jgi:hypothetical protein
MPHCIRVEHDTPIVPKIKELPAIAEAKVCA